MAGLQIHQEELAGLVTLRLEGTLDGRTAQLLRSSLEQLDGREVVVDFGRLSEFKDNAVGVLTGDILCRKVHLRGLATHHARMFRYFGVDTVAAPRAWYAPEELISA